MDSKEFASHFTHAYMYISSALVDGL